MPIYIYIYIHAQTSYCRFPAKHVGETRNSSSAGSCESPRGCHAPRRASKFAFEIW